ncbi:MAG: hypothetical protein ACOZBW_07570 [Thermodesulfobacteriota bacterium]
MKQRIAFFVLVLLLCFVNGALALNILTDDQMTRISGSEGITIAADDLKLLIAADNATLNLNPDRPLTGSGTGTGHFLNIEDGADAGSVAVSIGSATAGQAATIDMRLDLDVADDGTRTFANLALYNWNGDLYLKADRLEANNATHSNNFLFGLSVGEINFAADGTNPSMYMRLAAHDPSGSGISGELGMKLLIDEISFTGINNGTAHGVGLLFCQEFNDNASATHLGPFWNTSYWLANTASGMWTMGNLDYKPLTLDVATYSGNQYIIMTIQGHFTKRHTYPDMGSSNMGSTTVWIYNGTRYITNPNNATWNDGGTIRDVNAANTWNSDLGEVRLDFVEAYTNGSIKNIGGLSLEDLAMERTYMVITPDGDPYQGHPFTTNALNPAGNETELPPQYRDYFNPNGNGIVPVTWNTTF